MTEQPRNHCRAFFLEHGIRVPVLMERMDFDAAVETKQFKIGPFVDQFGDGYGEPYNPARQAFGTLKDGRGVFCELS